MRVPPVVLWPLLAVSCGVLRGHEGRERREDPAATTLLAEARAARATWDHFPGFRADVTMNVDGAVQTGKVEVDARGRVHLDAANGAAAPWGRRLLGSIVGHRLTGGDSRTPCFFPDKNETHPLGRAVQVVNDEFHSSYRIRDRQIVVVNRTAKDTRFTITVLENQLNAENKFLPTHYVVNTWDATTGRLVSSEAHRQTWQRVGSFDLPRSVLIVSAAADKQETNELRLSSFELVPGK